jgi:DNA-binding NarL/FixJ family response regulator
MEKMGIRISLKSHMTKILIAEDHQIFNDGLKNILSADFEIVAQIFHGRDVLHELQQHSPQIIILDINLPGVSGLELGKTIKKDYPTLKLIYLSMYNEVSFVKAAKEIGADGYLLKDTAGKEILSAIKAIEKGETIYDNRLNQNLPNLHNEDFFVKQYSLSKRELEVISLIRQGLSSEQIATKLALSFETVRSHRKNIFLKLGFNKTSELVGFAMRYNL